MPSHRVREIWMGVEVETLEDLLAKNLRAVCVGINPSPVSVAAGHYYQGRAGQRFFARLREAGVIRQTSDGYEDDAALRAGIGFTDIVKRPTPSAKDVRPEEYAHGRELLEAKLDRFRPDLVIFTFKKTAEILFGKFAGQRLRGRAPARSERRVRDARTVRKRRHRAGDAPSADRVVRA